MDSYIGTKLISAEAMNLGDYNKYRGWQIPANENPEKEGYLVRYSDDYYSWSPKEVFEKAYLMVDDNPDLPSGVSIGPKMVDSFIKETHVSTLGDRTTLVRLSLIHISKWARCKVFIGSSKMNKEEMGQLIDKTLWYAEQLGIDTIYYRDMLK